ncbi:unnamed protein product [Prorocentrum cordatum]|uniref:Uncharacterized protein n=1 Tax=Prorocentrum cordatum TaxID=2364126 RepID=A0ABN9RUV8_9DINO|nr:unnamed protein product [Polarella glacialis]
MPVVERGSPGEAQPRVGGQLALPCFAVVVAEQLGFLPGVVADRQPSATTCTDQGASQFAASTGAALGLASAPSEQHARGCRKRAGVQAGPTACAAALACQIMPRKGAAYARTPVDAVVANCQQAAPVLVRVSAACPLKKHRRRGPETGAQKHVILNAAGHVTVLATYFGFMINTSGSDLVEAEARIKKVGPGRKAKGTKHDNTEEAAEGAAGSEKRAQELQLMEAMATRTLQLDEERAIQCRVQNFVLEAPTENDFLKVMDWAIAARQGGCPAPDTLHELRMDVAWGGCVWPEIARLDGDFGTGQRCSQLHLARLFAIHGPVQSPSAPELVYDAPGGDNPDGADSRGECDRTVVFQVEVDYSSGSDAPDQHSQAHLNDETRAADRAQAERTVTQPPQHKQAAEDSGAMEGGRWREQQRWALLPK